MVNLTTEYEEELPANHFQHRRLQNHVRDTIPAVKITSIREVNNKYLSLAFEIKKSEMRQRNGTRCETKEYLHATGAAKIPAILKGNLNWRLVTRGKYGQGTSFSHDASYANKYCNNRNGSYRVFIFCDVLVGNTASVYDNHDSHPRNADSYLSSTGLVLVKFDDFTYNPKFTVYYEDGARDTRSQRMYGRSCSPYSNETNHYPSYQQRTLLAQILRTPLRNEDFLNAIVLQAAKRASMLSQADSMRLPKPAPIPILEPQGPALPTSNGSYEHRLAPQTPNVHPTAPSDVAVEFGSANMSRSPFMEPTAESGGTRKTIFIILVIIVIAIILIGKLVKLA